MANPKVNFVKKTAGTADKRPPDDEEPKKKPFPLWIVILATAQVLMLGGIGYGFYYFKQQAEAKQAAAAEAKRLAEEEEKKKAEKINPPFDLSSFQIALIPDREDSPTHLEVTIKVDPENDIVRGELAQRLPAIRDEIVMFLSSKTSRHVATPDNITELRLEIKKQLNRLLLSGQVREVFFTDWLLQ